MHTHPRIREYVMVGANLPPPGSNRVNTNGVTKSLLVTSFSDWLEAQVPEIESNL